MTVNTLDEIYNNRELFSSKNMFSPPAERLPHVIRFELISGCNWGRCTYCEGYDGINLNIKSFDEYKEHIDTIWKNIGELSPLAKNLKRVFIGGGNALEVKRLEIAIDYTQRTFSSNVGYWPNRIALYGRTSSINNKN